MPMKQGRSLTRAATARLNQAIKLSGRLNDLATTMRAEFGAGLVDPLKMQEARALVGDLSQAIHEFNAYSNIILTE